MNIKTKIAAVAAAGNGLLAWASVASAQTVPTGLSGSQSTLTTIGSAAKISQTRDLPALIGNIINVILGLLGIVFVILVIYSGIQFMLAQGDSTKVGNAIGNIRTAVIGMVITVAAYAISNYVISAILTATV